MSKRAILVFGVEGSGGRLWTRHVIACGAYGDGDHDQRLDKSFDGAGPLIAWRRSFPHFNQYSDIHQMIDQLWSAGYADIKIYWTQRRFDCCIKSQVRAGHAANETEARDRTERGLKIIGDFIEATDLPHLIVQYEGLADLDYRTRLLRTFDLEPQSDLPAFIDANAKWLDPIE